MKRIRRDFFDSIAIAFALLGGIYELWLGDALLGLSVIGVALIFAIVTAPSGNASKKVDR